MVQIVYCTVELTLYCTEVLILYFLVVLILSCTTVLILNGPVVLLLYQVLKEIPFKAANNRSLSYLIVLKYLYCIFL